MSARPLHSKEYNGTRHLMNPQREYVKADHTNIRETFARVREQTEQPAKRKVHRVK